MLNLTCQLISIFPLNKFAKSMALMYTSTVSQLKIAMFLETLELDQRPLKQVHPQYFYNMVFLIHQTLGLSMLHK